MEGVDQVAAQALRLKLGERLFLVTLGSGSHRR